MKNILTQVQVNKLPEKKIFWNIRKKKTYNRL